MMAERGSFDRQEQEFGEPKLEAYSPEIKQFIKTELTAKLRNGELRNVILDIGSGVRPEDQLGRHIAEAADRFDMEDVKVVSLDMREVGEHADDAPKNFKFIGGFDIEQFAEAAYGPPIVDKLKQMAAFFGVNELDIDELFAAKDEKSKREVFDRVARVDTIILSDVVNYFETEDKLREFLYFAQLFLKKPSVKERAGKFLIYNQENVMIPAIEVDVTRGNKEKLVKMLKGLGMGVTADVLYTKRVSVTENMNMEELGEYYEELDAAGKNDSDIEHFWRSGRGWYGYEKTKQSFGEYNYRDEITAYRLR